MEISDMNGIYCQVKPPADIEKIKKVFEYNSVRWKDGPYSKIKVSKPAHMCNMKQGEFLSGFMPSVIKYTQDNNIPCYCIPSIVDKPRQAQLIGISLRPDQLKLLHDINTHHRGIIKGPPGIGKTVMAGATISQYPYHRAVMVVHTTSLLTQTLNEFKKWFGEEDVGCIGDNTFQTRRITVIMAPTAASICTPNRNGRFTDPRYKELFDTLFKAYLFIVDEAHHFAQENGSYAVMANRCKAPIRIGFTATTNPKKTKPKEALVCEGYLGPVIGELTMEEGIDKKLLATPKLKLIPVGLNADIGEYKTYKEIYRNGIILNRSRNRMIVKEANDQVASGNTVLIMITDVTNDHGKILQEMAHDLYGLNIAIVQGSTKSKEREWVKEALQAKEIKCVIATTVWREGINIPSLGCIINACGGKSEIVTLQAIGRGLRTSEGKDRILVVDFLDPYKYLAQHAIMRIQTYVETGCM